MTRPSIRFLHSSDFHLERPLCGVSSVPESLYDDFLEAPYRAACRVFDAALVEEIDFVILAGDLVDARAAGPRGVLFLVEQFARLAKRGIAVYWAGGSVDRPTAWPRGLELPDNVHVFERGRPQTIVHQRDGVGIAHLSGTGGGGRSPVRVGDFQADSAGLFSIAVAYSTAKIPASRRTGIDYWALGGSHQRTTVAQSPTHIHYPGSPQGRNPREAGPHGCTLIEVDGEGAACSSFIPTDVLRWYDESVDVSGVATREHLKATLAARTQSLLDETAGAALLIRWNVDGNGPLIPQLRHGPLQEELLGDLRRQFSESSPVAWSVSLDVAPSAHDASQDYEEDTILGDFLRELRDLESDAQESIDLAGYLTAQPAGGPLGRLLAVDDPAGQRRVLRQARGLGIDLLSGEER